MKRKLTTFLLLIVMAVSAGATVKTTNLKVNGLQSPLGIDTETPTFSWETLSDSRAFRQSAYEITVRTDAGTTVWKSGKVQSARQNQIRYEGSPLQSCSSYEWTLTVYGTDGQQSTASTSSFGTAFLPGKEWTAQWIAAPKSANARVDIPVNTQCRYVKLDATRLGLPASTDARYYFLQLAEMEIYSGERNVARTATVSASDTWTVGAWNISYLTDGIIGGTTLGYTTHQFCSPDQHVWIVADLGETMQVDRIVLYPRQDDKAQSGTEAANFPSSYTIQTATSNGSDYTTVYTATDAAAPSFIDNSTRVPYFGCNFDLAKGKKVSRARLYASGLGVFAMTLNGSPVTQNVLEPGESEYEKTILYSTYDVTPLLRQGSNTVIARLAGGIFNVDVLSGRYSKGEIRNSGTKAIKAELHIDYTDGTSDVIATDDKTWHTKPSPTLGSNWWGGEDYDARLAISGISDTYFNVSQWPVVEAVDAPAFASSQASGFGRLKARSYEPLRVVEEWKAVDVKSVYSGGYHLYVVDFGRNFAGQYRFKLKGKAGLTITLREGESLNADGSVFMENYYTGTADTYETYTFAGTEGGEEWGPEFMYHGFRYLQIIGLDEAPSPSDFTAMRIRSNMEQVGTFTTSNQLLNDIHTICRDGIQSQLYNSITDCPQREKLGWLDVPNEMYNSLVYNYDMETFFQKVVLDCFDAQYANGRVPSTVPHFMSVYDDDPNWGGAAILVPYRSWRQYGDRTTIAAYYDKMKLLMDYYTSKTIDGIMPGSSYSVLSDWGQETAGVNPLVPGEFTITTTYYYMLRAMAEVATELGHTADAEAFSAQADKTRKAFNARYYKDGNYANGRQSEQAMPLYYGLVDAANETLVAARLAERVKQDSYKIKTGEIALKPLFMSLARYGYNDIVYQMANQTDCPSYGWWVEQGYTTTPEYWDVGAFSQNHCMMDHIEEWFFSQLGGITNGGFGCDTVNIAPWLPADMNRLNVSTHTIYGKVGCSWERTDGQTVVYTIEIPANSIGRVTLPCAIGSSVSEGGKVIEAGRDGVLSVEKSDESAVILLGSGTYALTVGPTSDTALDVIPTADATIDSRSIQYYSLCGQPLASPRPGLCLSKGMKMIVKN